MGQARKWWSRVAGKNIRSKLLLRIEGAVWVKLQVVEGNNMTVGVVYVNPEGVGVQETEILFEMKA